MHSVWKKAATDTQNFVTQLILFSYTLSCWQQTWARSISSLSFKWQFQISSLTETAALSSLAVRFCNSDRDDCSIKDIDIDIDEDADDYSIE